MAEKYPENYPGIPRVISPETAAYLRKYHPQAKAFEAVIAERLSHFKKGDDDAFMSAEEKAEILSRTNVAPGSSGTMRKRDKPPTDEEMYQRLKETEAAQAEAADAKAKASKASAVDAPQAAPSPVPASTDTVSKPK